jgi:hypothetical protein
MKADGIGFIFSAWPGADKMKPPRPGGIKSSVCLMAVALITEAFKNLTVTFATLFPIVNPLGIAPIFLSLTEADPESGKSWREGSRSTDSRFLAGA